jgi:hypothetical protein
VREDVEGDEGAAEQELVGERVEQLAEVGDHPRERARWPSQRSEKAATRKMTKASIRGAEAVHEEEREDPHGEDDSPQWR